MTRNQVLLRLEDDWSSVSLGPWLTAEKLKEIASLFVDSQSSEALPAYMKVNDGVPRHDGAVVWSWRSCHVGWCFSGKLNGLSAARTPTARQSGVDTGRVVVGVLRGFCRVCTCFVCSPGSC